MSKQVVISAGDKYGKLTVLKEVDRHIYPSGDTRRRFLMQCDCGSEPKTYLINSVRNGHTYSCGCLNVENKTTHGMHDTRQYQCWADMKTRCDSKSNKFYSYYGGRGISYCDKWKTFEGFWEDMQDGYSDDLTINRRDNDGNYNKDNCVWDTHNFQGHMRRKLTGTTLNMIGGVLDVKSGKISARIRMNVTPIHLGNYDTEQEASEAYDMASELFYGDRPNKTVSTREVIAAKVQRFLDNTDKDMRASGSNVASAKLSEEDVKEIWRLLKAGGKRQKDIAEMFGVKQTTISAINRGQQWVHVTGAERVFRDKSSQGVNKPCLTNKEGHIYWIVNWVGQDGKLARKYFSVTKHGNEEALRLATSHRETKIGEILQLKEAA